MTIFEYWDWAAINHVLSLGLLALLIFFHDVDLIGLCPTLLDAKDELFSLTKLGFQLVG